MKNRVLTVGHSTRTSEKFIELLMTHRVEAVVDVRSTPYSRFNPQFNKDALKLALGTSAIRYVFMGKELGARSDDPNCYDGGKVQYERLATTPEFQSGIERVVEGSHNFTVALMCAEKEPLECHRSILVARELVKRGVVVEHILGSGVIETHDQTIARLMAELGVSTTDMFSSIGEIQALAYRWQGQKIAYDRGQSGLSSADIRSEQRG